MRMKRSNWRAPWMKVCVAVVSPPPPPPPCPTPPQRRALWTMGCSALCMPSSLLPTKRSVSSPRDARQHNAQKMSPQIVPFHSIILGKHWAQIICRNYEEMQILPLPLERRIISQGKTGPSRGANGEENKHEVGDAGAVQTNKPNKQTNK